jgi:hypothetical protein
MERLCAGKNGGSMIARASNFVFVIAVAVIPSSGIQALQHTPANSKSAVPGKIVADEKLIGAWQPGPRPGNPKGASKPIVYLPHGQGKNSDGGRFTWHLEGDYLVAQALSTEGKPTGGVAKIPILFTRDGKEYATFFEGGKLKVPFYRLLPNGKVDAHRTRAGGDYTSNKFLPKDSDDEENTPASHSATPGAPPKQPNKPAPISQAGAAGERPVTGIHVGTNVQVSMAWPRVPHAEVTMAADPYHADWLLAGSMYNPPPYSAAAPKVIVYASRNGGKTWQVSLERKNPNPQTYADPAFAYGPDGSLTFVDMYFPSLDATKGLSLQFTRTRDGGRTWSTMTQIPGLHDRPFLAVGNTDERRKGWLYCTDGVPDKSVFVSKDQAATFLPAKVWSNRLKEGVLMGNPVVTSQGGLVLLYTTLPDALWPTTTAGKRARRADPDQVPLGAAPPQAPSICSVAVVRSQDGGASFQKEQQIAHYQYGSGRGGLPMLATDSGQSAYKDRLYAVWLDMRSSGSRVMLSLSKDGGVTWSQPTLLSEQSEEAVLTKSDSTRTTNTFTSYEAFLPCVAVNKAGVVGVTWYDTRGLPPEQAGWNLRFRASLDGGDTWLPSVQVTSDSTLYTKERKKRFPTEKRGMYYQPGHTAGLAADTNDVFHPLWIDGRTGIRQVFTAAVTVTAKP